jgi:hypothetical protein
MYNKRVMKVEIAQVPAREHMFAAYRAAGMRIAPQRFLETPTISPDKLLTFTGPELIGAVNRQISLLASFHKRDGIYDEAHEKHDLGTPWFNDMVEEFGDSFRESYYGSKFKSNVLEIPLNATYIFLAIAESKNNREMYDKFITLHNKMIAVLGGQNDEVPIPYQRLQSYESKLQRIHSMEELAVATLRTFVDDPHQVNLESFPEHITYNAPDKIEQTDK